MRIALYSREAISSGFQTAVCEVRHRPVQLVAPYGIRVAAHDLASATSLREPEVPARLGGGSDATSSGRIIGPWCARSTSLRCSNSRSISLPKRSEIFLRIVRISSTRGSAPSMARPAVRLVGFIFCLPKQFRRHDLRRHESHSPADHPEVLQFIRVRKVLHVPGQHIVQARGRRHCDVNGIAGDRGRHHPLPHKQSRQAACILGDLQKRHVLHERHRLIASFVARIIELVDHFGRNEYAVLWALSRPPVQAHLFSIQARDIRPVRDASAEKTRLQINCRH